MHWKLLGWVASALVLTIVVTAGVMASAAGRFTTEETLTVYSQTAKYHHVDAGRQGFSWGDQDIFFDTLFDDAAKTHKVGMDRVTCTYLPSKFLMCIDEFTFDGRGKIVTSGTLHANDSFAEHGDSLIVSGGTDEFEGARGTLLLEYFDPETSKNTIHLLP